MPKKKIYESSLKAQIKWQKENYTYFNIRVKKGFKEKIKAFADSKGLSVSAFIKSAIYTEMGETPEDDSE